MWKCGVPGGGFGVQRPSDEDWRPLPRVNVGPTVRSVDWGGVNRYYMRILYVVKFSSEFPFSMLSKITSTVYLVLGNMNLKP